MITLFAMLVVGALAFILLMKALWGNLTTQVNPKLVLYASLVLGGVLLFAILAGKLHWGPALATMVLPFARKLIGGAMRVLSSLYLFNWLSGRSFAGMSGRSGFFSDPGPRDSTSETKTRELAMKLNHESGQMSGEVLTGNFQGRSLDSLSDHEVLELYELLEEEESKRLLEAYVSRHREHLSDASSEQPAEETSRNMNTKKAAEVLGVDANASEEEVISAHRRLMQRLHPDQGGSTYLAAEINEARRVLLRET